MTASLAFRCLAVLFVMTAPGTLAHAQGLEPLALETRPIERFWGSETSGNQYPKLEFRGGLELLSPERRFSSLSGIDFTSDGTLYAVQDTGRWFIAVPVEADGRLVGLADPQSAPILNNAGVPLSGKRWGDAEALRLQEHDGAVSALVTFEQVNDLRRFQGPDFVDSASTPVTFPGGFSAIDRDLGFESVAVARKDGPLEGAILLVAEDSPDEAGNHRAWVLDGGRAGAFSIAKIGPYDITDAAFLPEGDLLILERSILFPLGIGMRIRRIAEADILPGATVEGETLIEADLRDQIDNMEGLAVRSNERNETILAIVSDDNRNRMLQKTLLLYFALID